jgi:hypothetical protein
MKKTTTNDDANNNNHDDEEDDNGDRNWHKQKHRVWQDLASSWVGQGAHAHICLCVFARHINV